MWSFRDRASGSIGLAVGLSAVLLIAMAAPALGVLVFDNDVILDHVGYTYMLPQIGGRYVAAGRYLGPDEYVISIFNRQTGLTVVMPETGGRDLGAPAISGSRLAWTEKTPSGEVWYDDIADATVPRRLTTDSNDDVGVRIDGNHVVWLDGIIPGRTIRWFDLERDESGQVAGAFLPNAVTVDRGRIAWIDSGKRASHDGVYVHDIETGEETVVYEASWATTSIDPSTLSLHGDFLTWAQAPASTLDNKDVWVANVRIPGAYGPVTNHPTTQQWPVIFGDLLVWQDDRSGQEDLLGWWEPETPGFQDVARSAGDEVYPDLFGHTVAYQLGQSDGSDVALAVAPLSATRHAGADRYETAALISEHRFAKSRNVVIATGADFPDALSASALAGALECPLLLTRKGAIPAAVLVEMARLETDNVWLVGGTGAISGDIETQLDGLSITHQRVAGADRYATAKQVAYLVMDIVNSSGAEWRRSAFFVRGDAFPDALAVAPHAYRTKMPILLVRPGSLPADTQDAITFCYLESGYVVGGTGAVSAGVKSTIDGLLGSTTERWDGATRYETAVRCAREGVRHGWLDYDTIGVAKGTDFPDALGGGAACGAYGSPLVLTAPTYVPSSVATFFTQRRYDFGGMDVFGGTGAVSAPAFAQLEGYLD